jgi:sortase B
MIRIDKNSLQYKIVVGSFCVFIFVVVTIGLATAGTTVFIQRNYAQAQAEYDEIRGQVLRRNSAIREAARAGYVIIDPFGTVDELALYEEYELETIDDYNFLRSNLDPDESMSAINPDYVGWIFIDGTNVDYPVAQGEDNKRYMDTTCAGTRRRAGSIFMDYRCLYGFDSPLTVLYGHNSRSGAMFATLGRHLLDKYVHIFTTDEKLLTYRIIDIRYTDVFDSAYHLIGADELEGKEYLSMLLNVPEGSNRLLLLSTCVTSNNDDDRLLVLAVQVGYS